MVGFTRRSGVYRSGVVGLYTGGRAALAAGLNIEGGGWRGWSWGSEHYEVRGAKRCGSRGWLRRSQEDYEVRIAAGAL